MYRFLCHQFTHSLKFLSFLSIIGICSGEVRINEILCKGTERLLRWDANDQPFAGNWPAWWTNQFDHSNWKTGRTPIGYDLGSIRTNVKTKLYGISPSLYVRKKFSVSAQDANSQRSLLLNINYNDGFIAWLNGKEISRANNGETKSHIYWDQVSYRASSSSTRFTKLRVGTSRELLKTGENILAIQVTNNDPLTSMRLDFSVLIDQAENQDKVLFSTGSTVSYFPGLIEPSSDIHEPAILGNESIENKSSDWIELFNSGNVPIDISNWSLSDDEKDPRKWRFPETTSVPAKGYLLILADGIDEEISDAKYLHTNFKLDSSGEFLGLFDGQGNSKSSLNDKFPNQYNFYSYGTLGNSNEFAYLSEPSPGSKNSGPAFTGKVKSPSFSSRGGFLDENIELEITNETQGSTIFYTTDGSEPSKTNGSTYTEPVTLKKVSEKKGHVIRARAFRENLIPSDTKTNTYLIDQDPKLLNSPSLIITGDTERSLFDPFGAFAINGGQYVDNQWQPTRSSDYNNIINRGRCYERPIHAEFYFNDGSAGFRTDCGLRAAASSYSRPRMLMDQVSSSPWPARGTQKPSFNLYFREEYGNSEVQLPLNGIDDPLDTYKRFRVRAGKNDIKNPFIVDELVRRMSRDMGQPASTGVINTLYVNAELKGFYNMVERLRSPWFASVHGSDSETDWDTLALQGKASNVAEGDMMAWDEMMRRLNKSRSNANWARVLEMADVTNMIDYYLLNIYMATWDWPHNNWVAARERSDRGQYRLYIWDAEGAMYNRGNRPVSQEMIQPFIANGSGELRDLWRGLSRWDEFKILFADRINKHLFNGGVLDDRDFENSHLKKLADQLYGEFSDLLSYMNKEAINENIIQTWASTNNGRRQYLFGPRRNEFQKNGLWPDTPPPQFSQFGGSVPNGYNLAITNEKGKIYYTTDGSDPREYGGSVNPDAVSQSGSRVDVTLIPLNSEWKYSDSDGDLGTSWKEPEFNDANWKEGPSPLGFGNISNTAVVPRINVPIGTVINPRPRQITTYFRKSFNLNDAQSHFELRLKIMSDGGGAVYMNGKEIFRDSNLSPNANYETTTNNDTSDLNEGDLDDYIVDPAALIEGTNLIAVEMHNGSKSSSDMVMEIQLDATRTNPLNEPLKITNPMTVNARSFNGSEWSALTSASFTVDTVAPSSANLAIVEILYNPVGASEEERDAGFDDGDLFEFIKLKNISAQSIAMDGVRFSDGIYFDFSESQSRSLAPRSSIIIVSNEDAFTTRNGEHSLITGQYDGKLNNSGERVRLIGKDGNLIHDFSYAKDSPWPVLDDLDGHSIQIIDPISDHGDGNNWKASTQIGGGLNEIQSYQDWKIENFSDLENSNSKISGPSADPDKDGLTNFAEYALGTAPTNSINTIPMPKLLFAQQGEENYLFIEFVRAQGERNARFLVQTSRNLKDWENNAVQLGSESLDQNGNIITRYRFPNPISEENQKTGFLRLYITE